MIQAYPKIFAIGTDYIKDIFDGEVEITEKVDGSQFAFMLGSAGNIYTRSKGAIIYPETAPKMFKKAVDYVYEVGNQLPEDICFYGEVLDKPKHNALTYGRVPKHNVMLFGAMWISRQQMLDYAALEHWGRLLDLERVPKIYQGVVDNPGQIKELLERESVLGNVQIEGIVVKNYQKPFLLGGQPIPVMAGKLVREDFKEINRKQWDGQKSSNRWHDFCESFRTEARWNKAIQHLRDEDRLTNSVKDIGGLIKEIDNDIISEEKEMIKEWLFNEHKREILLGATRGFPEWYKERLLQSSFGGVQ